MNHLQKINNLTVQFQYEILVKFEEKVKWMVPNSSNNLNEKKYFNWKFSNIFLQYLLLIKTKDIYL
jgi:hypothetical protein